MRFQFSLATLLICTTVLAVVCTVAASMPVYEKTLGTFISVMDQDGRRAREELSLLESHPPTGRNIAWRLAWSAPLAIAATLGTLRLLRRQKSRRHTEPPVG
jgi:hypothetical protein